MDYRLAAARRLVTVDAANARARSIINAERPVFQFPDLGQADAALAALAAAVGDRIGRLEVQLDSGHFLPLATAWPCAPSDAEPETLRFVTAGHVLRVFLIQRAQLRLAALPAAGMRAGRVVMPDGRIYSIARWVCAAPVDVAVFDVLPGTVPCLGLVPDTAAPVPAMVAPIGYPLESGFTLFGTIDAQNPRLFYGEGVSKTGPASGERASYFLHDASTLPGYSGAPVFDPATRRVIGVHVWGAAGGGDWNDAVRISAIPAWSWLAEILQGTRQDPPADARAMRWIGGDQPVAAESLTPPMPCPPPDAGIVEDRPDTRDRLYQPGLATAQDEILPPPGIIGDQMDEGSCAAFAVAAAIERQLARRADYTPPPAGQGFTASVRMLDRMARRHDEWLEDASDGTSLRAVIKGFYHNGVCRSELCPYRPHQPDFFLTRDIARQAREITLGSYARVAPSVNDMRMAVQEAGAVIVSARVHPGWSALRDGCIDYDPMNPASGPQRHAFVIDGYTADGFVVQNSRGADWGGFRGLPGHALWRFADWNDNAFDAWVIRLAPRSPQAFDVSERVATGIATPRRIGLLGHMLHAERGGLVEDGTLGLGARGVAETAAYLATAEARARYDRLLLVFHEPLLDADQIARLALPLTARLKLHRTYAFHIAYGLDEMRSCRLRLRQDVADAAERYLAEDGARDVALLRQLGPWLRAQVEDFRRGARLAARRALRDALAVLPLFAGPGPAGDAAAGAAGKDEAGLPLALLSVGLGMVPARALAETVPEFRALPHLALAAPLPLQRARVLRLSDAARTESDLPGWRGSWSDLVAAAHGRRIRSRRGAVAATPQDLLLRADAIPGLLALLKPAASR